MRALIVYYYMFAGTKSLCFKFYILIYHKEVEDYKRVIWTHWLTFKADRRRKIFFYTCVVGYITLGGVIETVDI